PRPAPSCRVVGAAGRRRPRPPASSPEPLRRRARRMCRDVRRRGGRSHRRGRGARRRPHRTDDRASRWLSPVRGRVHRHAGVPPDRASGHDRPPREMRTVRGKRLATLAFVAGVMAVSSLAAAQLPTPGVNEPSALLSHGERLFTSQGCYGCHTIGKFGTPVGPDLSRVGGRFSREYLERWIRDPERVRPNAHMPKLELTARDVEALATYLSSLR